MSKSAGRILLPFAIFVSQWLVWGIWQTFWLSKLPAGVLTALLDSLVIKGLVWAGPFVLLWLLGKGKQRQENKMTFADLFKRPFPWLACVVFLCLTAAFLYTVRLASGLVNTHVIFDPMFLVFSVSAGVYEEIAFRGGLFRMQEKTLGFLPAMVIGGLLFTLYHYPDLLFGGSFMQLLSLRTLLLFVMGMVFSFMFHKWRNLALNMTVHTVWDILSYLFCIAG